MRRRIFVIYGFIAVICALPASAQQGALERQINSLPWQSYPQVGVIASVAQISLNDQIRYLDAQSTSKFLELNGNPPRNNEFTIATRDLRWFAIFAFEQSGYVRDDEQLDQDELLKILKQQNEAGIAERRKLNLPILTLDGWAVAPHYDMQTKRLEWGTRLRGENGGITVNYAIRILGRSGVMRAILVSEPPSLEQDIREFKVALRGFDFKSGERYAEFRQGDHVAEYGLAALIVGGAAAAAAKSGILVKLGKFLALGAIAVFGAIAAFFKRLMNRPKPNQDAAS